MSRRDLDVICLGRSCVDLYGDQVGGRLEDVQSFSKYVGGCPTNIAVGTARLGLRSALISRVGDEQLGRFVLETLAAEGVDTRQVSVDPQRFTALVILGIRGADSFPHIFYRENCADMALQPAQADGEFIAASKALLITGTHLSTPAMEAISRAAVGHARAAGTRVILDVDYRPVIWGLTGHGAGENRFIADAAVSERLQSFLPDCDLVVGTEEELHIAGGSTDTLAALRAVRALTAAPIVLKRGSLGCIVYPGVIPDDPAHGITGPGYPVQVLNTLGAGDAFMSGFLRGWLRDEPLERCCQFANLCGALVASRHGCAPAMPSWAELESLLARPPGAFDPASDRALIRLHRATTGRRPQPAVCALAFDHRVQLEALVDNTAAGAERIGRLKDLIAAGARRAADASPSAGVIVDDRFGARALATMTGLGWWIARPVERAGTATLEFEAGPDIGLTLHRWPREHVVKCLVHYHPGDPAGQRTAQEAQLARLYQACLDTDHELLLEVIPSRDGATDTAALPNAVAALYDAGIFPEWWKLPAPGGTAAWKALRQVIETRDPRCRGVLLLGFDAPEDELFEAIAVAAQEPICRGFAVGRSIFMHSAAQWLQDAIDDQALIDAIADRYGRLLDFWRAQRPSDNGAPPTPQPATPVANV